MNPRFTLQLNLDHIFPITLIAKAVQYDRGMVYNFKHRVSALNSKVFHMRWLPALFLLVATPSLAQKAPMTDLPTPPIADERASSFTHHGVTIEDPDCTRKTFPQYFDVFASLAASNA